MGTLKNLLSPILFLVVFWSCKEDKLTITKAGDFTFRRPYASIQFWDGPNPQKVDSIRFSNPAIEWDSFSTKEEYLLADLSLSGILDPAVNLKREKFPENPGKEFKLLHENGHQAEGKFRRQSGKQNDRYLLEISNKKSKAIFNLEESYGTLNRDISYLILDLIPGGYPEIVVLNEYYIMNGDNSNIYIYEVTE